MGTVCNQHDPTWRSRRRTSHSGNGIQSCESSGSWAARSTRTTRFARRTGRQQESISTNWSRVLLLCLLRIRSRVGNNQCHRRNWRCDGNGFFIFRLIFRLIFRFSFVFIVRFLLDGRRWCGRSDWFLIWSDPATLASGRIVIIWITVTIKVTDPGFSCLLVLKYECPVRIVIFFPFDPDTLRDCVGLQLRLLLRLQTCGLLRFSFSHDL
jgi:hypothetical protein